MPLAFTDIHCHLLPGIDDGARDLQESLAMARMAVAEGTREIVVTPHQLGSYAHNTGDDIRRLTAELQAELDREQIPLRIAPGGDVRIEEGMVEQLVAGEVLSLGDLGRHVLLELPHELYFPLEPLLDELSARGITGILSHPERNHGILRTPSLLPSLVDYGCLMQVTAGSLMGTFGPHSQQLAESMLARGLVHFISTDAHGIVKRRPLMRRAYERAVELAPEATCLAMFCENPSRIARGESVPPGVMPVRKRGFRGLFSGRRAG
ncbi:MAG: CpsB/CapC family capsule biosynthesis tyrosine phosphatase [Planctomycetota bacterium]